MIGSDLLLRYRLPKRTKKQAKRQVPKPPPSPGLQYLHHLTAVRRAWHARVLEVLRPALRELAGERQDMTLLPPPLAQKVAQLRGELFDLFTSERVTTFLRGVGLRTAEHARKEVSRVIGIRLADVVPEETISRFRRENVALITGAAEAELDSIEGVLGAAQTVGLRVEDLEEQIKDRFGVGDSRAALIARDQTLKLNSQIAEERMTSAGVQEYVWVTSRDERVRDTHRELDGKTFNFKDPPIVDEKTGRRANPGRDFQCRCTASPVIDSLFG